ncbi:MAG TPA: hypothetical protein VFK06_18050, partial [Candidatus Angelobacter sp.]|nr:hypothetical protein [Candidatus Angelobacter sp.]
ILRRKSSEYARAIVGLQENFQSTTILSHSTLIPAYIIIPIVTRNGLNQSWIACLTSSSGMAAHDERCEI